MNSGSLVNISALLYGVNIASKNSMGQGWATTVAASAAAAIFAPAGRMYNIS
jgi:hypothetical protein